ncbi:MAG: hypothetical protein KKI08_08875 [Armatimonadetes bacterium]|nr:hypothetical protein [Armatimonadota bacterium]
MIEIIGGIISAIIAILHFTADMWSRWVWSPTGKERRVPRKSRGATAMALPEDHRVLRLPNVAPRETQGTAATQTGKDQLPSGDEKA